MLDMPKQKLNKKQQELWDELQRKTDEFYDNVPEEEKQKWPNGDLYLPLRVMEQEYLKRITACIGRYRYICVSTHAVLIDALADMKLSVVLVYPDLKLKREYIRRYLARGNSYAYAKNIESTWHINLETLKHEVRFPAIVLSSGEYLLDWLPYLERIT